MYARTHAKASTDSKSSNLPLGRSLAPKSSLLVPENETQSLAARDRRYSPEPSPTVPLNRPGRGYSFGNLAIEPKERFGIQGKLTIGQPNDRYEQEADRVADQVMRMPTSTEDSTPVNAIGQPSIQRLCPGCEEELQRQPKQSEEDEKKKKRLQMQPLGGAITPVPLLQRQANPPQKEDEEQKKRLQKKATSESSPDLAPDLQGRISGLQRGGGQPLSPSERAFFEPRFGHDFSPVKIHTDGQAADMARSVNARAFTVGQDVVFGAGQYQPRSSEGQRLLAHELTHVVQQTGGLQGKLEKETPQTEPQAGQITPWVQRQEVEELQPSRSVLPEEIDPKVAAELGEMAINEIGYENLINMAKQNGLIEEKHGDQIGTSTVQRKISSAPTMIQRQFVEVLTPYAVAAGIASQADSPVPGPGDLIGLGILLVGLAVATTAVLSRLSLQECIDKFVYCTDYTPRSPCGDCLHYCRAQGEWPSWRCP